MNPSSQPSPNDSDPHSHYQNGNSRHMDSSDQEFEQSSLPVNFDDQQEMESRIAAMLLGEASEFEQERLMQLIAERPELAKAHKDLRQIHQRLIEIGKSEHLTASDPTDSDWKLRDERRRAVLEVLGSSPPIRHNEKPASLGKDAQDSSVSRLVTKPDNPSRPKKRSRAEVIMLLVTAACISFLIIGLTLPAKIAARRSARDVEISRDNHEVPARSRMFSFAEDAESPIGFAATTEVEANNATLSQLEDLDSKKVDSPAASQMPPTDALASIQDSLQSGLPQAEHFYRDTDTSFSVTGNDLLGDTLGAQGQNATVDNYLYAGGMPSGYATGGNPMGGAGGLGGEGSASGNGNAAQVNDLALSESISQRTEDFAIPKLQPDIRYSLPEVNTFDQDQNGIEELDGVFVDPQVQLTPIAPVEKQSLRRESLQLQRLEQQSGEQKSDVQESNERAPTASNQLWYGRRFSSEGTQRDLFENVPSQTGEALARSKSAHDFIQDQPFGVPPDVALAIPAPADSGVSRNYFDDSESLEESEAILLGSLGRRSAATDGIQNEKEEVDEEASNESSDKRLQFGQPLRGLSAQPADPSSGPSPDSWQSLEFNAGVRFEAENLKQTQNVPQLNNSQNLLGSKDNSSGKQGDGDVENSVEKNLAGRASSATPSTINRMSRSRAELAGKPLTLGYEPTFAQGLPSKRPILERSAATEPFSTFSLHISDVSFKLALSSLSQGTWPDSDRVRIEEFVNAFDYADPLPRVDEKVACTIEQAAHPFLQQRNVLRIAMRTAASGRAKNTPLRLTILLDNSGSMERADRRQTVRRALDSLTSLLGPSDQISLISFANSPRLLADSLPGNETEKILQVIDTMPTEGGTNIEAALQLAFEKASERLDNSAQNRVILLTDGAANLGDADPHRLSEAVTTMREAGIAFDAAGISAQDLNDEVLEALTRQGDGRYYLLDSAESVDSGFADQIAGALRPSAKNVKVQVEFNSNRVGQYKLLGFEKHRLKKEDFRNDQVDASEMAAAENGVAVYQFEPKPNGTGDVGSVSVRFQDVSSGQMVEKRWPIPYQPSTPRLEQSTASIKTASAAAFLASKLRGDSISDQIELKSLDSIVAELVTEDVGNQRLEQLRFMIQQARELSQSSP